MPPDPIGELRKLENGPETPDDNTSNRKYFHVMCIRPKIDLLYLRHFLKKKTNARGDLFLLFQIFSCFPVDSNVYCGDFINIDFKTKIFKQQDEIQFYRSANMFYNITRAVTITFHALKNVVLKTDDPL